MSIERYISEEVARSQRRSNGMLRRAVISLVDDGTKLAKLQVRYLGDDDDGLEHFEHFGFTSNPPPDCECVIANIGGAGEAPIIIASAYRAGRLKVATGEAKQHAADGNAYLHTKQGGTVVVHSTASTLLGADTATKGVARIQDQVIATSSTSAAFFTWVVAVSAALSLSAPSSVVSVISQGSSVVKAVD